MIKNHLKPGRVLLKILTDIFVLSSIKVKKAYWALTPVSFLWRLNRRFRSDSLPLGYVTCLISTSTYLIHMYEPHLELCLDELLFLLDFLLFLVVLLFHSK